MIFFFILFVGSIVGIAALYLQHKSDFEARDAGYPILFIDFMKKATDEIALMWCVYIWRHLLRFAEKRLRWIRILMLRTERFLFRATHRLHDAVQQHENSIAQNGNGEHIDNNKELPG